MNQPQGALSRRLAVLRRPPLVCTHSWIESTSVPGFFECEKCSGVYYYETAEEPLFAEHGRTNECAHGEPGHCIQCFRIANDPVHARQIGLTASRAGSLSH